MLEQLEASNKLLTAQFERQAAETVAKERDERAHRIRELIEANKKLTIGMNGDLGGVKKKTPVPSKPVGKKPGARKTGQGDGLSSFQQHLSRSQ